VRHAKTVSRVGGQAGRVLLTTVTFLSRLRDGKCLLTTNKKPDFISPPENLVLWGINASPEDLFEQHEQRLRTNESALLRLTSLDQFLQLYDELDRRYFDHMISRGVLIEMTPEEVSAGARKG
jgi:hypothetical protein